MAVDYASRVAVDTTMSLLIRLTGDVGGADTIPIVGATGDVIDVFVSPRGGFVVEGRPDGRLTVTEEAEPLPIQVKLRGGFFSDLYREIEKLPVETERDKAETTERLHAIGSTLFTELLPDDLELLLWELRDRVKTVWVQSAEPYVPWELCRLQGKDEQGAIVEGEFFCEAFQMTRWIPGIARLPELTLSNIGVIVPTDSGLESADAEKQMLHGLAAPGRTVVDIPPEYVGVRNALGSAQHDGIHFTGHGSFPDQSNPAKAEIELEGRKKLRPSDISGVTANFGRKKPLVFLNACQVGRQSQGLTGVGGWASALLRNGAAAFVGAHWEVTDDLALTFAKTFYERLDAGQTIAAAAREARLAVRDAGDPTWLAYTVFADPAAVLVG